MKSKAPVLVSIVAAAAVGIALGYMLLTPEPSDERQPPVASAPAANTPTPADEAPVATGPEPAVAAGPEPAAADMTEERLDDLIRRGFIPAEYRDLWLDPDYQRIAEERFNVIPKVARSSDDGCARLELGGEAVCWNEYGYHPYLTYAIEELRQMASTDAAAAEALVFLLPRENRRERMQYALEASRLSGKSGPIMRFAYSFTPDANSPRYFDEMLDRYAIAAAGESFGYPYRLSRELELMIRNEFNLSVDEFREALSGRRVDMQQEWGDPS